MRAIRHGVAAGGGNLEPVLRRQLGERRGAHRALEVEVEVPLRQGLEVAHNGAPGLAARPPSIAQRRPTRICADPLSSKNETARLIVPKIPHAPCTATAPMGSSTRSHSTKSTASTMMTEAIRPIQMDPNGDTQ